MRFYRGDYFTIRPSKTEKPVIIVSKKISNKAVVRNRLRRQIKEILRQNGLRSVIVKVTRHPVQESFKLFQADIKQCLSTKRSS